MNTQINYKKNREISHWFIFLVLFIISITFYNEFHNILFNYSTQNLIPFLQNKFILFLTNDITNKLVKIISFLGTQNIYIILTLLIYNISNIYKSYIICFTLFFSQLILTVNKLIFIAPRPYWINKEIKVYDCQGGFGSPSGHVLVCTMFYLTFWKIIFQSKRRKNSFFFKYFSLVLIIIFIIFMGFIRLLSGAHSLDQIIYGFLLGLSYFIFIFYVINVNCNNNKQLLKHLNDNNIFLYFVSIIICFCLLFFNKIRDEKTLNKQKEYSIIINNICPNIPETKKLLKETVLLFVIFCSYIFCYIGMRSEYFWYFEENDSNWFQYNFVIGENEYEYKEPLLSNEITITKETQWNHTSNIKDFFRLIMICVILILFSGVPYYFIKWNYKNDFIVIFIKVGVSLNITMYMLFFLLKIFLKWLKLTNLTLFYILRDSI